MWKYYKILPLIFIASIYLMSLVNIYQPAFIESINNSQQTMVIKGDPPISITGNGGFDPYKSQGNGSASDPYVIENFIINASGTGKNGIYIRNTNAYFIIRNCTITNAANTYAGIRFDNVTNGQVMNNTLMYNDGGIFLYQACIYNKIIFNRVDNNVDVGIFIYSSDYNTILNNSADKNVDNGIFLYAADHNVVINNTAKSNGEDGIRLYSACVYNNLTYNILNYNNYHGIELGDCDFNIINYNTALYNNQTGIRLGGTSNYNTLTHNMANYNHDLGFGLYSSSHNILKNNTANYNNLGFERTGIYLDSLSNYTDISYNTIGKNEYGIRVDGNHNNITWNFLFNNLYHILNNGLDNTIDFNNCTLINLPPSLTNGNVYPFVGDLTTLFAFYVTYSDEENATPTNIQVIIDGMPYTLTKQNPNDNNYIDGCLYEYSKTLPHGIHNYYFNANDGLNSVRYPSVGTRSGPTVNILATLINGIVTPSAGNTSTLFTYYVNYTDLDNDTPISIQVGIEGVLYDLVKDNPNDNDYTDGCLYNYSTPLSGGAHQYWFETSDGYQSIRLPTVGTFSGPYVDYSPSLSSGNVTPSFGNSSTLFTYSVNYSDLENKIPIFVQVVVNGTTLDMDKQNPADNNYTDGCIYNYSTILAGGYYEYYFIASDGNYSTRFPSSTNRSGPLVNNPPTLAEGMVSPSAGNSSTLFTYFVKYTDLDNNAPASIQIGIEGVLYDMIKHNSNDNVYTDGCLYNYSTSLSMGPHQYWFETSDGYQLVRTPKAGNFSGPYVDYSPSLSSGNVTPSFGTPTTLFTYSINYSDQENRAPLYILVVINGTGYDLIKQYLSDEDYTDGCFYNYTTILAAGSHDYYFIASDGNYSLRFPSSANGSGPLVNNPPTLAEGMVSPSAGNTSSLFTYFVKYTDLDNNAPASIQICIQGVLYDLIKHNPNDDDYTDGCLYNYSTTLSMGPHQYWFETSDGFFLVRTPEVENFSGPYVDYSPSLSSAHVTPLNGNTSTIFTFSINYIDPEDKEPYFINTVINGTSYPLIKQNLSDNTYFDGCIYNYSTYLTVGRYEYYFIASDGNYSVRSPDIGNNTGPIVIAINHPPILSAGFVTPLNGTVAIIFTFSVNYSDSDNDAPLLVRVIINDTPYYMTKFNLSDTTYSDGCVYIYSATLSIGNYTFYFIASDGIDSMRLPSIECFLGPQVSSDENDLTNPIPIFSWHSIIILLILFISSWGVLKRKQLSILP